MYEVWRDNDEAVGTGGINHQQLYSGEFDIEWGQTITDAHSFKKKETHEFKSWLQDNNYNWNDPKLALGYIKLGQVDLVGSFGTDDFLNIYNQLIDCLNIKTIEYQNYRVNYDYTLDDKNWKAKQIKELKKGYESHSLR